MRSSVVEGHLHDAAVTDAPPSDIGRSRASSEGPPSNDGGAIPARTRLLQLLTGGPAADRADDPADLEPSDGRLRLLLTVALGSIIVGGTVDLLLDEPATWLSFHVIFELLMLSGALVMATTLWLGWWRAAHAARALAVSLERQSAERARWQASARHALEGLAEAIDVQFDEWRLTPTEREVALLLLKGHGHKQIAAATDRSERTVRQHAGAVYQKAGLGGRAELAAFFLHDLMLPEPERVREAPT